MARPDADTVPATPPILAAVPVDWPVLDPGLVTRLLARVSASGTATETTLAPFTGGPLAAVPLSTAADVAAAVDRAGRAQQAWAAQDPGERARVLLRLHDLVLDRRRHILDVIQWETGKARRHAFEEVVDVAAVARYYGRTAQRALAPQRRHGLVPGLTRAWVTRRPVGVVGVIAAGNYPFTLGCSDALAALAAGNAVVAKPDTRTALSTLLGVELAEQAGLPPGLWQVVAGDGPEVGGAVVAHADAVCFTGSTAAGRQVAAAVGQRLVPSVLELGGKNALLVLADADVGRAVDGAVRGAFATAGQVCVGPERLYAAAPVYDAFVDRLVERVRGLKVAAGFDWTVDVGSLASAAQLARVREHVDDAVGKGAELLAGGHARPDLGPWFFEPTVLAGVTSEMACNGTETFGPLVAVHRVADEEAAVAAANDGTFGLAAAVFTGNPRHGRAVAGRLRAGLVTVNDAYPAGWGSVDLPVGGLGDSGTGVRHGPEGLLAFTVGQSVAVQRGYPLAPPAGVGFDRFAGAVVAASRLLRRAGRR